MRVVKIKNKRTMVLSNYVFCGGKNSRFIKEQEARGLLLGLNLPFGRTPLIGSVFVEM